MEPVREATAGKASLHATGRGQVREGTSLLRPQDTCGGWDAEVGVQPACPPHPLCLPSVLTWRMREA